MAWTACNNLHNVWTSSLDDKIKINTFKTMIEPNLLYGSGTWTLNARQQQRLDGTYTRLLMRVLEYFLEESPYSSNHIWWPRKSVSGVRIQKSTICWSMLPSNQWSCVSSNPLEITVGWPQVMEANICWCNCKRLRNQIFWPISGNAGQE